MEIAVIGAGRYGSTLATLAIQNGHNVTLLCLPDDYKRLCSDRHILNTEFVLDENTKISTDFKELSKCEVVFVTVPGPALSLAYTQWGPYIKGLVAINTKALLHKDNNLSLPTDLFPHSNLVYFSSGAFPEGLMNSSPAIGTVYGDREAAKVIRTVYPTEIMRIYSSTDMIGGQIGAAMKNVIALASGIVIAMGFDEMTRAALITRGALEIARFGEKFGAKARTFGKGSSFLADLIGTCFSPNSHHLKAGQRIFEGKSQIEIEAEVGTVDGFCTLGTVEALGYLGSKMPIATSVHQLIHGRLCEAARKELMSRPL